MYNLSLVRPICVGAGLVALDIVISGKGSNNAELFAGGSCGNVLTILSYFGWSSHPIARLSNNPAGEILLEDLKFWRVKDDLLSFDDKGSTPIIIHRILKDNLGLPKHRFEFRNPEDGSYLPSYKPFLAKEVASVTETMSYTPNVFYFDRINRSSIELAKAFKQQGATIFFEPSNIKDLKGFHECLIYTDILKFSSERIPEIDEVISGYNIPLVIQTLGIEGLRYKIPQLDWTQLSGYSTDQAVDAAGAGDWCSAGIITSLFRSNLSMSDLTIEQINDALDFGQALSAMNCTFAGARGLMYAISAGDLVLSINHIRTSASHTIPARKQEVNSQPKAVNISSLFATL